MRFSRRAATVGGLSLLAGTSISLLARAQERFAPFEGLEDFWLATDAYIYGRVLTVDTCKESGVEGHGSPSKGEAMGGIVCKRCQGTDYVKRGTVRNLQRYQCKACGCNFTNTPPRGKPPGMKALALMLYAMGNMSFCSIARLLGVSDVAVLKWVRNQARQLPEPAVTAETVIITLDDVAFFSKKDLQALGLARV